MNWLLLRGLGREQRHWHDFPERLRRVVEPDRVLSVDLAGTGSERLRLPLPSVPWLARDVARRLCPGGSAQALAVAAEQGPRWCVIGLSLGGMVALELCRLWSPRVQSAIIINASARITSPLLRLRPSALSGLGRTLVARGPGAREAQVLELTSHLPAAQREFHAERAATFEGAPQRYAVLSQLCAAARFFPPPPDSVSARLWFLGSRRDRLVNAVCSRDLAWRYGAVYLEHPWAGHDLPLDDPEWVCACVARVRQLDG